MRGTNRHRTSAAIAPTMEEADADLKAVAAVKGWNDEVVAMAPRLVIFGDPDTMGEQIAKAMGLGIDGVALNLPVNGHDTQRIGLLGEIAQKVIAASGRN